MFRSRAAVAAAGAVVGGVVVVGGVAMAAIPDDDGTITGCHISGGALLQPKGDLRLVDSAEECRRNETPITWNQQGAQGPPGPKGEQGEPGEDGSTEAWVARRDERVGLPTEVTADVVSLDLPPGSYVITAKTRSYLVFPDAERNVVCRLEAPNVVDRTDGVAPLMLTAVVTLDEAGEVVLACNATAPSTAAEVTDSVLHAVTVGTIHEQ